jgi:hypothetical protein
MPYRETRGNTLLRALRIGAGTLHRKVVHGNVTVDPPSVGANTTAEFDVPVSGVAVGDRVSVTPPATLNAGLFVAAVRAKAGNITIRLGNCTAGALDAGSATWGYTWIDLT